YSAQTHVIYNFPLNIWTSADATWYVGGRSSINGVPSNDLQRNWRIGGTIALPVNVRNSVKLAASRGVSAVTGNNFDLIGIFWQYRFGGGL
ncbi:MAG TPA: transporter, partial [Burkholderiaceae bacterium]|nr:transporter [Burkholderiaceae bacterium]